jgi:F-type H+-transporting ATPase subunit b
VTRVDRLVHRRRAGAQLRTAREKHIAAELADAAAKQKEARVERDAFAEKNKAFDAQRAGLLGQATEEAAAERKKLLTAASQAADAAAAQRQGALQGEADALHHALGARARQEVFAIARETLAELASVSLEERVCAVFIERLRALDGPARERLAAALASATGLARLRSAFELSEAQRTAIQQALNDGFGMQAPLRFELAPALVAGIQLNAGGQRLEWSIAHHVESLEKGVDALVKQAAPPTATAAS